MISEKLYCAREKRFKSKKILNYLCDMLLWIFISPKVFRHSSYSGFLVLSIFKIYFDILDVLHHYPLDLFSIAVFVVKLYNLGCENYHLKPQDFDGDDHWCEAVPNPRSCSTIVLVLKLLLDKLFFKKFIWFVIVIVKW